MICWQAVKKRVRHHWLRSLGFACNDPLGAAFLISGWIRFLTEGKVLLFSLCQTGGLHSYWHHYISALGFNMLFPPSFTHPHPPIHSSHPPPAPCSSFKLKALHSASGENKWLMQCFPGFLLCTALMQNPMTYSMTFHYQAGALHWPKDFIPSCCVTVFRQE